MAHLRNTVRAYAIEDPSPARILTRLNKMMCRLEPGIYATASVAVWNERNGTMQRSDAGHPPVLQCRSGEFEFLTPSQTGLVLGVDRDHLYQEEGKVLQAGSTLLFYTDGLIELRGQNLDGMDELLGLVKSMNDVAPRRCATRFLHGVAKSVEWMTTCACWRSVSSKPRGKPRAGIVPRRTHLPRRASTFVLCATWPYARASVALAERGLNA